MDFIKGMDISMLPELEKAGARYYENGMPYDIFDIFEDCGVNAVRLRIWNDPYDEKGRPYGGGTVGLPAVLDMAGRICEKNMLFILDFHYSDFWTDPRKQKKPKAWEGLPAESLGRKVYEYTVSVLQTLNKKNLSPQIVQVGNEITNGFLWPDGQLPEYRNLEKDNPGRDYERMFSLLGQGIRAVRDAAPGAEVMLHLDYGGDNGLYREWFDAAWEHGIDYDIIGLSYYPYWHGTLSDLRDNLGDISGRYQKDVLVAETSYGFTVEERSGCTPVFDRGLADQAGYPPSPQGQADFLKDLTACVRGVSGGRGRGFIYWEPAWIPLEGTTWATAEGQSYICDHAPAGNTWANQALFDYDGNVLPGLAMLKYI